MVGDEDEDVGVAEEEDEEQCRRMNDVREE